MLQRLGSQRALTVFGRESLDEISISGQTLVGELRMAGSANTRSPEQFNLPVHDPKVLQVANVEESKAMLLGALDNRLGAPRDIVALNAGASIYVCQPGRDAGGWRREGLRNDRFGRGAGKVDEFVGCTRRLA